MFCRWFLALYHYGDYRRDYRDQCSFSQFFEKDRSGYLYDEVIRTEVIED